jgi:hypothetical protein
MYAAPYLTERSKLAQISQQAGIVDLHEHSSSTSTESGS